MEGIVKYKLLIQKLFKKLRGDSMKEKLSKDERKVHFKNILEHIGKRE